MRRQTVTLFHYKALSQEGKRGQGKMPISAAMVLLGYFMFFVVIRQNRYASRVIEVQDKQKVIDTGLYAVVRHPMYDAVLLLYVICYMVLPPLL